VRTEDAVRENVVSAKKFIISLRTRNMNFGNLQGTVGLRITVLLGHTVCSVSKQILFQSRKDV
jgi:hypothetical protein